jgi:hypothetical protein
MRKIGRLTFKKVKNAKPRPGGKTVLLCDGGGLWLQVRRSPRPICSNSRCVVTRYAGYQAPRPLRTESEVAEKEGAQRIVTGLPAPDLSMKELRIGHNKNERPIFGKTNPIRADGEEHQGHLMPPPDDVSFAGLRGVAASGAGVAAGDAVTG